MPKTRKNRGGAPRVPPGTKYDNKGRIIRLGPTPPTTPPPPPPPLALQRGYNRSAQPDEDMRGSQPTTPPDLRTAIAALPPRSQAAVRRLGADNAARRRLLDAFGAPVSQTSSTGEGSRKNKKRRKSRKNKKRRKSRKNRKPSRKAGCWPFGSCTTRSGKSPKGKKTTHRRKISPPPPPRNQTQGKRGTRRFSPRK